VKKLIRSGWLYAVTVRYLKPGQLLWRIWYRLIWWPTASQLKTATTPTVTKLSGWQAAIVKPQTYSEGPSFRFLNREVDFNNAIEWQYAANGRLWTYNLHYFDFLNAASNPAHTHRTASDDTGYRIIQDWINNNPPTVGTGWEPYPTSLRIVNWIKWTLDGHPLSATDLDSLFIQARWLFNRVEHHILANHLFTNLKALCFAGVFFDGPEATKWRQQAITQLHQQLDEQILADGAHFELSPMYHDIILEDVLDLLNLLSCQPTLDDQALRPKLTAVAQRMLNWSLQVRHPDGRLAFFNDSAFSIAPAIDALCAYASRLSIDPIATDSENRQPLSNLEKPDCSGLAVLRSGAGFALFDIGSIGPDYQPGHAHADSLSFEYSWREARIFVNSGTSTYTPGALRNAQRSTRLHNTVEIDGVNSSQVWGGFRVASRARTEILDFDQTETQSGSFVVAKHDGYTRHLKNVIHTRKLQLTPDGLEIEDHVSGNWSLAIARFYLHPTLQLEETNRIVSSSGQVFNVAVTGGYLTRRDSEWYPEFGDQQANTCLEFHFSRNHSGSYVFRLLAIS